MISRRALLPLLLLLVFAGGSNFPPIPPLPAASWPAASDAMPFARALVASVPPGAVAEKLIADPDTMPAILRNLGTAIMSGDAAVARYAGAVARAAATKSSDIRQLAAIAIVDPLRYGEDAAFRARMNAILPMTFGGMPHAAKLLDELNASAPLDFETSEAIALAAHLAKRGSDARRVAFDRAKLEFPDDLAPIDESFYSMNAAFFTRGEETRFLAAVHEHSPRRRLVVLGDAAMRVDAPYVTFVDVHERPFTPWPRDPFLVARAANGGVVFVNRPNVQPHREEDRNMVRALVDGLPAATQWTVAPAPFHNGNVLLTPAAVWITMHSVEPRALAILGLERVPVESFATKEGAARYVRAVRQAADELHAFYRKPVRFVHSFDDLDRLGGGAGIDLDSVVTLLPKSDGACDALVGDLALGARVVRETPAADWDAARRAYGFGESRDALITAQTDGAALQAFLDDIAAELKRDGMRVTRLPLLNVPASLVKTAELESPFLVTWNNVVLETRGSVRRAEGFSALFPAGDGRAREAFAAAGYRLDFLPPLLRSVELGGGYRCASNHLR